MALEDISQLLRKVPSTQPRRRSTPESQQQPPELLGPIDAEVEVELPAPLCLQLAHVPGCRSRCHPDLSGKRTTLGRPCRISGAPHRVSHPSGSVTCHISGDGSHRQWCSTLCRRRCSRLVLWGPRVPWGNLWNPLAHYLGRSKLSRRKYYGYGKFNQNSGHSSIASSPISMHVGDETDYR